MSADKSESVYVTRRLHASPERVFAAWVEPNLLQRWLSPSATAEARSGGHYRLEVSKPEDAHVVSGEYREFVPGQRLVMTWVYESPMAPEGKMEALLTVELRKDGDDTEISLRHARLTNPQYLEAMRQGAWTEALDGMEALLAGSSK